MVSTEAKRTGELNDDNERKSIMPIDIAVLAATVVSSFLFPYVKMGAEEIFKGASQKVGEGAALRAKEITEKVWQRVKSIFSSEEDRTVLSQFERRPDAARSLIQDVLREKLEQNSSLADELHKLINTPGPEGSSTGAQIMHAYIAGVADLRNANLSNAHDIEIAGVKLGEFPPKVPPPSSAPIKGESETDK